MPPNHFESEVESFLEGSHGDRTHIKRADHHTVTPLCGTLLWIGYAHPDRLISYPHARYLSACILTPESCPPTGAATSPNISPLRSSGCAAASNRAAGQNSPRSACSQPKRDKTLPACTKRPKMRVFWRAGRILSREHPKPATPGEFCHGKRSTAAMPDEFRHAFSCTAAR